MAIWLFAVAAMVFAMVLVGGGTRLTDSGLSITEWRPVTGAIPPLNLTDWQAEFARYQQIPQYRQLNLGMSLGEFQTIYWWEWTHRLLGRVIGVAFLLPFLVFLTLRRIPRRLLWPCVVLFALGGLQGLVGWWMVASGLVGRVDVAPERLTAHLGLALVLFCALVWTGLEAWRGRPVAIKGRRSRWGPPLLLTLVFAQCLLGGLVAGNDAGRIFTDWPLFAGSVFPPEYAGADLWATLAHSRGAVQLHHRLGAYVVFGAAIGFAWLAHNARLVERREAMALAVLVSLQAALGIATLMHASPVMLSAFHQAGAVLVLTAATVLLWRSRRGREQTRSNSVAEPALTTPQGASA